MIRVLLADDHQIIRQGVEVLLAGHDDISVSGTVRNGFEVMRFFAAADVDVAVVDITMPGPEPAELLAACREAGTRAPFVALTMHTDPVLAQRVVRAGYLGFVHKDDAVTDLLQAVRRAHIGRTFISPRVAAPLASTAEQPDISEREQQVLHFVAEGLTNRRIAAQLQVSIKTVETYRSRLMKKLNVHSAPELIRVATRQGWL